MRWKYPVNGERRTRTIFLWWPWDWNGTTYWLEWVRVTEVYSGYCGWWTTEIFTPLKEKK